MHNRAEHGYVMPHLEVSGTPHPSMIYSRRFQSTPPKEKQVAIQKMSEAELRKHLAVMSSRPEYLNFFRTVRVGEGGAVMVADEKGTRQTIRSQLFCAARAAGKRIVFVRSPPEELVFKVVERVRIKKK